MSYAGEFDELLEQLPADWAFFECHVTVADPARLSEARVALARANGRPQRAGVDHDFEITVANRWGRGARAGVVRSALRVLDDLGVPGRIWTGAIKDELRPAPAHRYGP